MTGSPDGRLPDWIVVGAMKSGTTTVARWLKAHPEAWLVPNKEVHFFSRDDVYANGADWYRGLFAGAPAATKVGEGTPSYLFVPEAPARMAALVPAARLVVCVRHPADRAYSHYWHNRHRSLEGRAFADAVRDEMADPQWKPPGYLMRGRYHAQLQRVLDHYPADAVHVVATDDLATDPSGTFAAVCRHVGVDDRHPVPNDGEPENTYREHRAERLYGAMFKYRLWRWIPAGVRPRVSEWFTKPSSYEAIDPTLRSTLVDWFADDIAALEAWLGRDLGWR